MQIHYFQRYHSKENVDTSNTMLMLSRLYAYNADKFYSMFNSLILEEDDTPEITFELQVVGSDSVPDAIISQKSFKVVVETKLHNQFDKEQLLKHLNHFDNEDVKVILTLDPKPMKQDFKEDFERELRNHNESHRTSKTIKHVNLTFEQLVEAMEDIVDDRDTEIVGILDDFKNYCLDEGLIPESYKWMRAIVTGTSLEQNLDLNLYYDMASRGYTEHGYIGLYKEKSIRAIGKLIKIIVAEMKDGQLHCKAESGDSVTEEEKDRIRRAIQQAEDDFDFDLKTIPHRYFLVDQFYQIDFRKASKNPIQRSKYFNLADMFGYASMPGTAEIARDLDGRTWEEFI